MRSRPASWLLCTSISDSAHRHRLVCLELGQNPRMRRSGNVTLIRQVWQQLERVWPILVLDEAQNLSATALGEVRLLTCQRRDTQPPFSLLLIGDEQLSIAASVNGDQCPIVGPPELLTRDW